MKMIYKILLLLIIVFSTNNLLIAQEEKSDFRFSFIERFRLVTWDNAITLSDAAKAGNTFNRTRTSLMGEWLPNKNFEVALKFTNEFRYYFVPGDKVFDWNEIFFDNFYVKYKDTYGSITLGRQNIMLGEGFVVMDGHPLDGSRSIYFNGARADINISQTNKITLFATYQPVKDDILPRINDFEQALVEQPETGIGGYLTTNFESLNLQTYYIFKKIGTEKPTQFESNIHTVGARVQVPLDKSLSLTGEAGYQFGDYGKFDRSAFGGYAHLDYTTNWEKIYTPKTLTLGAIFLSGDDPTTTENEGWDPLFSRWPKWSESYIYTQIKEFGGRVAYWSNLASIYGSAKFVFSKEFNFCLDYHHLMAPQKPLATAFPGGTGTSRGDLVIAKLNYVINEYVTGHILWEYFNPGNFYFNGASDYNWARIEFLFKI